MSTATAAPTFLKDLLADPVKYPDASKYLTADGRETTLGDLRAAAKTQIVKEAPESPNAETDKRISEVLESKKKKKHPVEARIGELTKKAAEAEELRLKDKAEFEAKLAEQNEKNIKAELERRKAEAAANDKRPSREEFPGDANGTSDYTQKMAEWVVRQQEKITPKVAAAVTDTTATVSQVDAALRKEEFDGFLETGREFMTKNPDFNDVLEGAAKRGLTLNNAAMLAIIKMRAANVAYYLAKPENEAAARKLMTLDAMAQVAEVGRIAERLTVNPADFVSRAPAPGPRLTGGGAAVVVETDPDKMDTDTYLQKRRADIKAGLRRR